LSTNVIQRSWVALTKSQELNEGSVDNFVSDVIKSLQFGSFYIHKTYRLARLHQLKDYGVIFVR
jgi:hypothetical protein